MEIRKKKYNSVSSFLIGSTFADPLPETLLEYNKRLFISIAAILLVFPGHCYNLISWNKQSNKYKWYRQTRYDIPAFIISVAWILAFVMFFIFISFVSEYSIYSFFLLFHFALPVLIYFVYRIISIDFLKFFDSLGFVKKIKKRYSEIEILYE